MTEIEPDYLANLTPEQRQVVNRVIGDAVVVGNGFLAYDHDSAVFTRRDPFGIKVVHDET